MKKIRWSFFARLRGAQEYEVRAIPVEQELQDILTSEFASQGDTLCGTAEARKEPIAFDGGYSVGGDEVAFIDSFSLPDDIVAALKTPLAARKFTREPEIDWESVKAIFGGVWGAGNPEIVFQAFDRRRLLSKRLSIILSEKTFSRLTDPGLILDVRAAAVFRRSRLFFSSYFEARKVLDLAAYYREATDQDLLDFAALPVIGVADEKEFVAIADAQVRRKIALIRDHGVLEKTPAATIAGAAAKYGLPIPVIKGKIQLPPDKRGLKAALKLLDEDYFTSELTGNRFVSNSKRRLK